MPPPAGEGRDRCRGTNRSARDGRPRTSFGDRSVPLLQTCGSQQRDELFDRGRQAPTIITSASRSLAWRAGRVSSTARIIGYASAPPPAIATTNLVPALAPFAYGARIRSG